MQNYTSSTSDHFKSTNVKKKSRTNSMLYSSNGKSISRMIGSVEEKKNKEDVIAKVLMKKEEKLR